MATATKKDPSPSPSRAEGSESTKAGGSIVVRGLDAAFRFLASLKLAVFCLATLAGTLAVGTWYNSQYGQTAVNEYIHQTKGFALLLAFLGTNILCAALIRYPWSKRQTGFVITHAGLLIVIGGSWWAAQTADEGLLGMREGETSSRLIRSHKPMIYVKPVDPHSGQETGTYKIPVHPGSFDWPEGKYQVVSEKPTTPFKLAIKRFYAASMPRTVFVSDPSGSPMIKIRPMITPPGTTEPQDVFKTEEDRWLAPQSGRVMRTVKDLGTAQFIFSFVESHEVFDDFLSPPADPGKEGVARLRYEDRAGKHRVVEVRVDDAVAGRAIPLPDSDLTASFVKVEHTPIDTPSVRRMIGEDVLNIVQFNVRKGAGPEVEHNGYASLPTAPAVIPRKDAPPGEAPPAPLIEIGYFFPPIVDAEVNRRYGVIEVMGDDHGRMAYRVFGRGKPAKVRSVGLLKLNEQITAFGGTDGAPMTMTFRVEEFLQAGKEQEVADSITLPAGKKDDGLAAILAELTVGDVTRDVWLRKSPTFDPSYHQVAFPDALYQIAYDVDQMDLGFSMTLNDFDVGFDPGTQVASSYRSELTLTDEAQGIKDKPVSIFMNHTLDHRGWRFFQTNYSRYVDPKTGRETGEFVSVFQVAKNPARELIYVGCIIVVLGAFVQFYMRAGLFTDGGRRERERAAARARERLQAKNAPTPKAPPSPPVDEAEAL